MVYSGILVTLLLIYKFNLNSNIKSVRKKCRICKVDHLTITR